MSDPRSELLQELMNRQGAMTDRAFAAELGISRQYWAQFRLGGRALTANVMRNAAARWSDLEDLVKRALLQSREVAA